MSSNKPITPTEQRQLNVAKIMDEFGLPKAKTNESYKNLLKQEEKKLFASLPPKINELKKEIAKLTQADHDKVAALTANRNKLDRQLTINKNAYSKATKARQLAELNHASTQDLLTKEKIAITDNDGVMLGEKLRVDKATRTVNETRDEIAALEANVAPEVKAALEAIVARETNVAAKSFIPKSILIQICSREENKTFFTSISDTDFEKLKKEAESLLLDKKQSGSSFTNDEREKISIFEFESLKRDVKSLLTRHQTEAPASILEVTKNDIQNVSKLLENQKKIIDEKIKKEQAKALKEEKNKVVNSELPPEVKLATDTEAACEEAWNKTNQLLTATIQELATQPAVYLPPQLKINTAILDNAQRRTQQSEAVKSATFKHDKLKDKKALHEAVKIAVAKQIKTDAMKTLVEQHQKSNDPEIQKQLDKALVDKMKKLEFDTPALENAVAYCIGQLEQVSPSELNALKQKCDNAGWKLDAGGNKQTKTENLTLNNFPPMSDILESTYHTYLEEGFNKIPAASLPELRKEEQAHQQSLQREEVPLKQPEPKAEPAITEAQQPQEPLEAPAAKSEVPLPSEPQVEQKSETTLEEQVPLPPAKTPEQEERDRVLRANPPTKQAPLKKSTAPPPPEIREQPVATPRNDAPKKPAPLKPQTPLLTGYKNYGDIMRNAESALFAHQRDEAIRKAEELLKKDEKDQGQSNPSHPHSKQ